MFQVSATKVERWEAAESPSLAAGDAGGEGFDQKHAQAGKGFLGSAGF